MSKCKICNREFEGKKPKQALSMHIKSHNISMQEYYDTYTFTEGENVCDRVVCSNETKFKGLSRGYGRYCSNSCSALDNLKPVYWTPEMRKQASESKLKYWRTPDGVDQLKINSKRMMTENPNWTMSDEDLQAKYAKQSATLKDRIKNGEFTPCVTNSWANSKVRLVVDGSDCYYRSTWDAVFHILNPQCEYERLRIPYTSPADGDEHIYLVDFIDNIDMRVYEIKPSSEVSTETNQAKERAAREWCEDNGYIYTLISNDWFMENASKVEYCNYEDKVYNGMKQFLV